MTPNFALSLSFDGIRLLQRAPDGWNLVGEVSLETPDLAAALADLRAKALDLAPEGLRTKLVIPPDQIRFMTLETAQTSLADVRQALEGQTPYALDELVIDFDRHGGRTHIAAVARETLAEAEAFAVEHKFAPVGFVAVPEPYTFAAEVFFGPTRAAGRTEVSRDSRPVVQTGVVAPAAEAATPEAPATDAKAPAKSEAATNSPARVTPDLATETATASAGTVETAMPPPQTDVSAGSPPKAGVEPVFASRTRPELRAEAQRPTALTRPAAVPGAAAATERNGQPAATIKSSAGPGLSIQSVTPVQRPAVTVAPIKAAPVEPLFTRRKEPPPPAPATSKPAQPAPTPAALAAAAVGTLAATPTSVAAAPLAAAGPKAPRRDPAPEPLSQLDRPRGKPRFLGLILTAILLVVMLLVWLWASTLPLDGIAGWFRGSDAAEQTVTADTTDVIDTTPTPTTAETAEDVAAATADSAAALPTETSADAELAEMPQVVAEPGLPVVRAPAGRVLSPAEADRIYAATGVYQRAPRLTVTPRTSTLDGLDQVSLLPTPAELPRPAMPVLDAVAPDAVLDTPLNPPGANAVFERDDNGNILATPDGTIMPDGAVVFAGAPDLRPVARPRSTRPVDPDTTDAAEVPTVLPRLRPADLGPSAEAAPTPQTDDPAEAVLAQPDSARITTGPPPIRPRLRPQTLAALASPPASADDAAPDPGAVALNGIRPRARPATTAEVVATLAPLPPYTGPRPVTRPQDLAPEAVAEAETSAEPEPDAAPVTDINAVAAAIAMAAPPSAFTNRTRLAVSVTPRPDARPRNFAQVVASARAVAAPVAPRTNTVRAAAAPATPAPPTIVAPSGNVPGGVARAATQEDAINLRQMNLVGVYGKPNQRRALVRLGNGRYVKVEVGSNLDGGQVTAIGDSALNFVKRGRTYALVLPAG